MSVGSDIGSPLDLSAVVAVERCPPQTSAEIPTHLRVPAYLGCPRCHCKAVHRSRRRGLDWIMSAIGFRPARCFTCDKRFYTRHFLVKAQS
jgi:hypothetical protein